MPMEIYFTLSQSLLSMRGFTIYLVAQIVFGAALFFTLSDSLENITLARCQHPELAVPAKYCS